jgi:hypothetical protein
MPQCSIVLTALLADWQVYYDHADWRQGCGRKHHFVACCPVADYGAASASVVSGLVFFSDLSANSAAVISELETYLSASGRISGLVVTASGGKSSASFTITSGMPSAVTKARDLATAVASITASSSPFSSTNLAKLTRTEVCTATNM